MKTEFEKVDRAVRCSGRSLLVPLIVLWLAGCAPKPVYIPHEWHTAPPPQAPRTDNRAPQPVQPPGGAAPQGPVIKRTPEFREKDLSSASEPKAPLVDKKPAARPPQYLASMHLVDQGRAALSKGSPDAAIPLFEQAVQVDVHNGEAFMGLARAWRMKGAQRKALEFARKAEIHFQDDTARLKEVYLFQAEVCKELGDMKSMEQFRQKASRL